MGVLSNIGRIRINVVELLFSDLHHGKANGPFFLLNFPSSLFWYCKKGHVMLACHIHVIVSDVKLRKEIEVVFILFSIPPPGVSCLNLICGY